MLLYLLFLFGVVSCSITGSVADESVGKIGCNERDAFLCVSGECVLRYVWCDGLPDCWDHSDEDFCYGVPCLEGHFQCKNGRCIPQSGFCDGIEDCTDGSDEECGIPKQSSEKIWPADETAVSMAATFLIGKMKEDGWGDFTPRAVVALSFADKASPIGKEDKTLMMKQLDVHLKTHLLINSVRKVSALAHYVNALYSTCQDPRNYQGQDLVGILRSEADNAMKLDFTYPIALLTLCIADEVRHGDFQKLEEMYARASEDNEGFRALVVMAMVCIRRKTGDVAGQYLASEDSIKGADIYTKALYVQAVHAVGTVSNIQLRNSQLPDGSFGDMLATYSAIPALLNSSLLDLRCTKRGVSGSQNLDAHNRLASEDGKITYSLWFPTNTGNITHSRILPREGSETFYDIMRLAETQDPLYRFLYDETDVGKKVYSLAGIPNDAESEKSWVLYEATADVVTVYTPHQYMEENKLGVDRIYLRDKNHFIFWLK